MSVASVIIGLIVGVVVYLFGQFVGVPQPLLGIIAFAVFLLVAFYGKLKSHQW